MVDLLCYVERRVQGCLENREVTVTAYIVDHYKTDPHTHTYCAECYRHIPPFLVRHVSLIDDERWENVRHDDFDHCEACGRRLRPGADD